MVCQSCIDYSYFLYSSLEVDIYRWFSVLAHVHDMTVEAPTVESVPIVCEFPDVFPVDLPRLPLE